MSKKLQLLRKISTPNLVQPILLWPMVSNWVHQGTAVVYAFSLNAGPHNEVRVEEFITLLKIALLSKKRETSFIPQFISLNRVEQEM